MNEEQYEGNKVRITFELAAPYSTIQEELDDYISDIRELAEVRGFTVLGDKRDDSDQ